MRVLFTLTILMLGSTGIFAQIKAPAASPAATISQEVGFSNITIEYNRPQLKGRDMFANLTRVGEVWRTGANMSTRLTITEDISIEGKPVAAGKYSIYSIPGKKDWTIIINNKIQWGTIYNQEDDYLRFTVPTQKNSQKSESFAFYFDDVTEETATLGFKWDNIKVEMNVSAPCPGKGPCPDQGSHG